MKNVFVLNTGRCGSTTFARACTYITNYTVAHESQRHRTSPALLPAQRVANYPENHIEVDNRLSWMLGILEKEYGDDAFYVHLLRDREETARSFVRRWNSMDGNIIFSYAWGVLSYRYDQIKNASESHRLQIARDYWHLLNDNIQQFLANKSNQATIWLHDVEKPFREFWRDLRAEGDLEAALREWNVKHNATATHPEVVKKDSDGRMSTKHPVNVESTNRPIDLTDCSEPSTTTLKTVAAIASAQQDFSKSLLDDDIQASLDSRWSLDADTLKFVATLIGQLKPKHILEIGSGVSTRLLYKAAQQLEQPCYISSVDHDPDFMANIPAQIGSSKSKCLSIQLSPLVSRRFGEQYLPVYHIDPGKFACPDPVDLCIIDGPPVSLGGRKGTLYQLMEYCRVGSCLLLDDAIRNDEKEALVDWKRAFGDVIEIIELEGFEKGLSAIVIKKIVKPEQIWNHMVELTLAYLNRHIAQNARVLLIDDFQWPNDLLKEFNFASERDPSFPPAKSHDVIKSLNQHLSQGVDTIVFGWPAFWWLDHFKGLEPFLESRSRRIFKNGRVIVYKIGQHSGEGAGEFLKDEE